MPIMPHSVYERPVKLSMSNIYNAVRHLFVDIRSNAICMCLCVLTLCYRNQSAVFAVAAAVIIVTATAHCCLFCYSFFLNSRLLQCVTLIFLNQFVSKFLKLSQ